MKAIDCFLNSLLATDLEISTICLRLLLAWLLGIAIGFERQRKREGAGIRTFSLIAISCCAGMCLSIWIPQNYADLPNGDPGRIAAQIITGVGFLGAGCILRSKASVQGMTTAATVWTTAIIGMLAGASLIIPAIVLTLLTLFALIIVSKYEKKADLTGEIKILTLHFNQLEIDKDLLTKIIARHNLHVISENIQKDYSNSESIYDFKVQVSPSSNYEKFFDELQSVNGLKNVSLSNF
ncbi:MAG: MgtC/SapB family protein [Paludibacteraceae bacterium]|nr:MgtC/SapB family protein [Paludibacteraceae bacterium]